MKVGDVVKLKSGGPKMTIDRDRGMMLGCGLGCRELTCVWFDDNKLIHGYFSEVSLKKVEE